jgi:lysophospholipase L1-like esterase
VVKFRFKKELILVIVSPIFFVLLFEVLLHIVNFTYYPVNIGFNITPDYEIFKQAGEHYTTKDNKLGIFRNQSFLTEKPENEFRIFILGGSSIYNLNTADYLTEKLQNISQNKKIKVINIGGNAYGTNRLLLHFQEIMSYSPDLIVLYSGHNEFNEKFLKETIFKETLFSRISDRLVEISRFYQFASMLANKFMVNIVQDVAGAEKPFFPPNVQVAPKTSIDIKTKQEVYLNYENNIIRMIAIAKQNNVQIVISTVAYNRRFPPVSDKCNDLYDKNRYGQAYECFTSYLDNNLMPDRASRTSNNIVKDISNRYNVPLADVDQAIIEASEHSIPGFDLFIDNCHLNPKGNIILQDTFYATIVHNHLLN